MEEEQGRNIPSGEQPQHDMAGTPPDSGFAPADRARQYPPRNNYERGRRQPMPDYTGGTRIAGNAPYRTGRMPDGYRDRPERPQNDYLYRQRPEPPAPHPPAVYPDRFTDDPYDEAYRAAAKQAAEAKSRPAGKRPRLAAGLIIMLFALFGAGCAVFFCVRGISSARAAREQKQFDSYNAFLIPVAATAPESFDDLSDASMEDLIRIAVWSIIGSGVSPEKYAYSDGALCIPAADAEAAYTRYFGTQRPIEHRTVEGYGYEFRYSEEDGAYYVPMTTLEPVYTPRVISVSTKSGAQTVECELINTNVWKQDSVSGDVVRPDADLCIRVTFRENAGARYISSIRSLGVPETAIPSAVYTTEAPTAVPKPDAEPTTEKKEIVITRD